MPDREAQEAQFLADHLDRFVFVCPECQAWQVDVHPEAGWTLDMPLLQAIALAAWSHQQAHQLGRRYGYAVPVLIPSGA